MTKGLGRPQHGWLMSKVRVFNIFTTNSLRESIESGDSGSVMQQWIVFNICSKSGHLIKTVFIV